MITSSGIICEHGTDSQTHEQIIPILSTARTSCNKEVSVPPWERITRDEPELREGTVVASKSRGHTQTVSSCLWPGLVKTGTKS